MKHRHSIKACARSGRRTGIQWCYHQYNCHYHGSDNPICKVISWISRTWGTRKW